MSKILSLIISIIYLLMAYLSSGGELLLYTLGFLLLPLTCIWLGEEWGGYTGRLFLDIIRQRRIIFPSPACLVELLGWILLILPAIITLILIIR